MTDVNQRHREAPPVLRKEPRSGHAAAVEEIPLQQYPDRTDTLHRIHTLSSTETSGIGETITSGVSSREDLPPPEETGPGGDCGGAVADLEEEEEDLQRGGRGAPFSDRGASLPAPGLSSFPAGSGSGAAPRRRRASLDLAMNQQQQRPRRGGGESAYQRDGGPAPVDAAAAGGVGGAGGSSSSGRRSGGGGGGARPRTAAAAAADRRSRDDSAISTRGAMRDGNQQFDELFSQHTERQQDSGGGGGRGIRGQGSHSSAARRRAGQQHGGGAGPGSDEMDDYYYDDDHSPSGGSPTGSPGLKRGGLGRDSKKRKFLGKNTTSAWMKWSADRRASFKRRLEFLDNQQKEREKKRVTAPVKKARKESLKFVHPELEESHIPQDPEEEIRKKIAEEYKSSLVVNNPEKKKKKKKKSKSSSKAKQKKKGKAPVDDEVKLSVNQWNVLIAFWEHDIFVRARYVGMVLSFLALILGVVSITNSNWSHFSGLNITDETTLAITPTPTPTPDPDVTLGGYHSGLWIACQNITRDGVSRDVCSKPITPISKLLGHHDWQNAVIGLLIFSVAFGFLATILSICGVCSTPLPRKIYYYHSSGEIYFICALACTAALITYPLAIESDKIHLDHTYGYGYGLGWGSSFFFFASAICMTLDDIIKEMAKGVCCGGEKTNEMRV